MSTCVSKDSVRRPGSSYMGFARGCMFINISTRVTYAKQHICGSRSACLLWMGLCVAVFLWVCVEPPVIHPSSAPGLKPHVRGTGAAGGRARVGGSLDSTPRGVWRRKTPISKTNDVPIAHANTQIVYQEPGGRGRRHGSPAEGCVSAHFRSGDRRWRGCRCTQFHKSKRLLCLHCWLHTKRQHVTL